MSNIIIISDTKIYIWLTGGKITVDEAWNEGTDSSSLRAEGRMIKVKLSAGNTAGNLGKLAQLAICAKADHVSNSGK